MTEKTRLYRGLPWVSSGVQAENVLLYEAKGEWTPHHYRIRVIDDVYVAYAGFSGNALGWVILGRFTEVVYALLCCERHDFAYGRQPSERVGEQLLFAGSELTHDMVDSLGSLPDGEEIMDLLSERPRSMDGRLFHRCASFFEARKGGLKQNASGSSFTMEIICPANALPMWLLESPKGTDLSLGAIKIGQNEEEEWRERSASALKRAHILPLDPLFIQWMRDRYDQWGLIAVAAQQDSDALSAAVGETLKRLLGVPSRRDLLINRDAVERIERLDRDFYRDLSQSYHAG